MFDIFFFYPEDYTVVVYLLGIYFSSPVNLLPGPLKLGKLFNSTLLVTKLFFLDFPNISLQSAEVVAGAFWYQSILLASVSSEFACREIKMK